MKPCLWLVLCGADPLRNSYRMRSGIQIVGRADDCHIRIGDSSVSRRHAELVLENDRVHVRDLGSSNGTWVRNLRIGRAILRVGDIVRFGFVTMRLVEKLNSGVLRADKGHPTAFAPGPVPAEILEGVAKLLSDDENLILRLLLNGLQYKQIARHLKLSTRRVYRRVQAIYAVVGVGTRAELMARLLGPDSAEGRASNP